MKIERIKKSHKKEIVIGGLILLSIVSTITLVTTKAKYRVTQDIKLVSGTVNYTPYDYRIAYMNIDGTAYTCSTTNCNEMLNYIPNSLSYALTSSSYCETKNENGTYERDNSITLNHQNNTITTNLKQKKAKCYLYFADSEKPTISNVTTSVTKNSISVTVSASDNVGVTEYYYQIGSNAVVKQTANTYTFNNLSAGTTYSIKVYVKDAAGNQSDTTTKSVATEALKANEAILANVTVKTSTPDFSQKAMTDEGVYKVSDSMYGGYSYYWRGAVTNNHVKFANRCWRIIRINGDGSIRLIYNGLPSNETCPGNGDSDTIIWANQAYNVSSNNSSYVGWTYTEGIQRPTLSKNANGLTTGGTNSNAKKQTELALNFSGTNADKKVAIGKFCNDRSVASGGNPWTATGASFFYYGALKRVITDRKPTLYCDSRDVYELKVGAITVDEVMYAGGTGGFNSLYYLHNGQKYWTMSPYEWDADAAIMAIVYSNGQLAGSNVNATDVGLRPVINLRSDVTFSSGNGTQNNPYVVS